jgi:hypothetical protein
VFLRRKTQRTALDQRAFTARAKPFHQSEQGAILGKQTKALNNNARLKEMMTARPMTAERHAEINRKRIRARRMLEDARELRSSKHELF